MFNRAELAGRRTTYTRWAGRVNRGNAVRRACDRWRMRPSATSRGLAAAMLALPLTLGLAACAEATDAARYAAQVGAAEAIRKAQQIAAEVGADAPHHPTLTGIGESVVDSGQRVADLARQAAEIGVEAGG